MRKTLVGFIFCLISCSNGVGDEFAVDPTLALSEPPVSRCMNLGSALEAMYEGEWGYTVRREDLVRMSEAGFDTVRLPVRWSVHSGEAPPYAIDPAMLARVSEIVGWAGEIGLKIIVNVHHYNELNADPEGHEPRLEAIWDQLATHFAGAPDHLIFETINEPHTNMSMARTDALNKRLLARIRHDHPERWVVLGTAFWGNLSALEESRPDHDPKVMLTYHEYSPHAFTHQGAPWSDAPETGIRWGTRRDVERMYGELDKAVAVQDRLRMPILVGEFGVYDQVPIEARARWTRALREGLEARDIAWCYWDFAGSLKAYDVATESWIPEIRAALLD